ncbi:hypothetical protein [Microbacterium sp. YY-01]|uniref:hypothetical protein n=1 Tax=Microbacterium sp. YY-01 TaxID=3421634 RepID=UPI003D1793A9
MKLLNTDLLFQTLLREAFPPEVAVVGDLDPGSYADLPLFTHYSTATQEGNGNGLWSVMLTVTLICETQDAFGLASELYSIVWSWNMPRAGVVPGVGAIETVQDSLAPARRGGEAQMEAKQIVQYDGSWNFRVRND